VLRVRGDTQPEGDELFTVTLSNPTNATISPTHGSADGIITNDDQAVPENQPPAIIVGPDGTTVWDIPDTEEATPFQDLSFVDPEMDPESGTFTVVINFDTTHGELSNFGTDVEVEQFENGYLVTGTLQAVNFAIKQVT